jgi:outer membrane protein assembly factor BamD
MRIWNIFFSVTVISLVIQGCGGMETENDPIVREEMLEFTDEAGLINYRARNLEEEGDFKGARVLYEDLISDYPDSSLIPETIFHIGRCLEEEGEFADAINWYEDLVDDYPDSDFAPEAQFQIGICLEKEDRLLDAFDAYQKLFDEYPGEGSLDEILKREYAIGKKFMNGRKRLFLFFRIRSGLGTAEDIFRAILKNATFSKVSPRAQYSLARVLQLQGDYEGAISEYNQVLTNYPGTEYIQLALFNIGVCHYNEALSADYDSREVDKALRHLNKFVKRFPDDPNLAEAEEKISELIDSKAEKAYAIAEFYNTPDSSTGARIYYQEVIDRYPKSRYADSAREKLEELPEPDGGDDLNN